MIARTRMHPVAGTMPEGGPAGRRLWRIGRLAPFAPFAVGGLLLFVALAYLLICAYPATQATQAERHPVSGTPADVGLAYEPIRFESEGDHLQLRGWYVPASGRRAIIMVHGLDGNRWGEVEPGLTRLFADEGYDVLLFDLRGHGESEDARVGFGWFERRDVLGAVRVVEARGIPPGRIGVFGASYGGSVALLAAAESPDIGAVAADSPFADARDLLDNELRRRTGLPSVFVPGVGLFTQLFYGLNLAEIPPDPARPRHRRRAHPLLRIAPAPGRREGPERRALAGRGRGAHRRLQGGAGGLLGAGAALLRPGARPEWIRCGSQLLRARLRAISLAHLGERSAAEPGPRTLTHRWTGA
jgi:pimeloyl-ACP methyl ester carboxylesterase